MAKGYWIVNVTVTDEEHYPEYLKAGAAVHKKYNSRFLVRGGQCKGMEGDTHARNIVVEFKDYDTAVEAYNSEEYRVALGLRKQYADSNFLIVEGFE